MCKKGRQYPVTWCRKENERKEKEKMGKEWIKIEVWHHFCSTQLIQICSNWLHPYQKQIGATTKTRTKPLWELAIQRSTSMSYLDFSLVSKRTYLYKSSLMEESYKSDRQKRCKVVEFYLVATHMSWNSLCFPPLES